VRGWVLAAGALLVGAPAALAQTRPAPPPVQLIATGGTISNTGGARLTGAEIARSVPGLDTLATLEVEQFTNLPSGSITPGHWLRLAERIQALYRAQPELAGVVVTHGTDTLEETAYFLSLTLPRCRPVVLTGAMRRATDVGADGPANLRNAVRTVLSPEAKGRGVLLLLNDEIFAAREVTKSNTSRMDAFTAPGSGPEGVADPDAVVFHREAPRAACPSPFFDVRGLRELPRVDVVYSYAGADGTAIDALVRAGAKGLVVASVGRGGTTPAQRDALRRAVEKGVFVVVSSRTGAGRVPVGDEDDPQEWKPGQGARLGAGDLNPQKARILLMLALTRTRDPREIAEIFRTH
jgi:L-asparaginase